MAHLRERVARLNCLRQLLDRARANGRAGRLCLGFRSGAPTGAPAGERPGGARQTIIWADFASRTGSAAAIVYMGGHLASWRARDVEPACAERAGRAGRANEGSDRRGERVRLQAAAWPGHLGERALMRSHKVDRLGPAALSQAQARWRDDILASRRAGRLVITIGPAQNSSAGPTHTAAPASPGPAPIEGWACAAQSGARKGRRPWRVNYDSGHGGGNQRHWLVQVRESCARSGAEMVFAFCSCSCFFFWFFFVFVFV